MKTIFLDSGSLGEPNKFFSKKSFLPLKANITIELYDRQVEMRRTEGLGKIEKKKFIGWWWWSMVKNGKMIKK